VKAIGVFGFFKYEWGAKPLFIQVLAYSIRLLLGLPSCSFKLLGVGLVALGISQACGVANPRLDPNLEPIWVLTGTFGSAV